MKQREVVAVPPFNRQLKRLVEKYPSLAHELGTFSDTLAIKPDKDSIPLGKDCFKKFLSVRIAGHRAPADRIVIYYCEKSYTVYFLSMFDRTEQGLLSGKKIRDTLMHVPF